MKKINIIILSLFVSLAYTEETKKDFQINKLHVGPNEDAYVASFKASANSFILEEITQTIQKTQNIPEQDILKESRAIAGSASSGVVGSLKYIKNSLSNINILELLLAF